MQAICTGHTLRLICDNLPLTLSLTMHAELILSFLVAASLLALIVFAIYMALLLPSRKAVSVSQVVPVVFPAAQSGPNQPQPISDSTAQALKQTDDNLKKRIIKLATKVMLKHHTYCSASNLHLSQRRAFRTPPLQSPVLQYCLGDAQ